MVGPSAFKKKPAKDDKEGYSFALTLREAVSIVFGMSDIAEECLDLAGLFEKGDPTPISVSEMRSERLIRVLEGLNSLPRFGFPDESGHPVRQFQIIDGSLFARKMKLRAFAGTCRINIEFSDVSPEKSYRMPYWKP